MLTEIRSGAYAKNWIEENEAGPARGSTRGARRSGRSRSRRWARDCAP